jgi:hypothetical protein
MEHYAGMEKGRLTWSEVRNLFPVGFAGVIALLGAEAANHGAHLWKEMWFVWAIGISIVLIFVGLLGFIADYKARMAPLLLMGTAAVAVMLHWPPWLFGVTAVAAFFTTLYFLSVVRDPAKVSRAEVDLRYLLDRTNRELSEARRAGDSARFEMEGIQHQLDAANEQKLAAERQLRVVQQQRDDAQAELDVQKDTFKSQVFRLARSLRNIGAPFRNLSDEEYERIQARWNELSPLYWAVKRNLESLLTVTHPAMLDLTKTVPFDGEDFDTMARLLDRLAREVPAGALAIPEPPGEAEI